MYKIAKDNLAALFQLIADKQELYLPVKNAGQTNYAAWTEEAEVDLDTLKTVKSAKDAFFPQSENLYTVKKENKKLKIEPEKLKELLAEAEEQPVEEEKEAIHKIVEKLPYMNLSLEGWGADALSEKFDSPIWEELYKPCLKCGTCTFVCPTCQCYDIKDYDTGHGVSRYRCWDSCMYSDFTMMAHGNNRTSQMQRFRQRFMHKLVYYPANNDGMYSCVGCGRCVEKCPSALNIVKVIKAFEKQGGND